MTVRIQVTYFGNVQGVGFRWNVIQVASSYSVTGYVKNLASGNVEMMVEGNRKEVFLMVGEVEERLKDYWKSKEAEERRGDPHFENFQVLYH
jgi:acylphosphatase